MREIWKDVPGYEGLYQASSLGRIKSVDRIVPKLNGSTQSVLERILKTAPNGEGYPQCTLFKSGSRWSTHVHCVIALTFHGECPDGQIVRHRDGVKTNCKPSNLRYGTLADNEMDKIGHGTVARGERHGAAVLTADQVLSMRRRYSAGMATLKTLAQERGASITTIHDAITGRSWGWL